jgi:hypothetical protein
MSPRLTAQKTFWLNSWPMYIGQGISFRQVEGVKLLTFIQEREKI